MYIHRGTLWARAGAFLLDEFLIAVLFGAALMGSVRLYAGLMMVGNFLYFGLCEGSPLSASLGKRLCGLIVVDGDGIPLSYPKSFLRALCRLLSGLVLGIGFFAGLLDENGMAFHDRLAHTFVADRSRGIAIQAGLEGDGEARIPQILGISGEFAGRFFPIGPEGAVMGRDQKVCGVVFRPDEPGVSRSHCKIWFNASAGVFILRDLGSAYGTFLGDDTQVVQGTPAVLRPGDEFYLAVRANLFQVVFEKEKQEGRVLQWPAGEFQV